MLHMDDKAAHFVAQLRRELSWLRTEYPHMSAMASVAETFLQTVQQAGATDTCMTSRQMLVSLTREKDT